MVLNALQNAPVDQLSEPGRQAMARHAQVALEILEAAQTEKAVAHDEQGPAIADSREGPRHRAFHLVYFRPPHDWFFF